jgi:hypothetical protein
MPAQRPILDSFAPCGGDHLVEAIGLMMIRVL